MYVQQNHLKLWWNKFRPMPIHALDLDVYKTELNDFSDYLFPTSLCEGAISSVLNWCEQLPSFHAKQKLSYGLSEKIYSIFSLLLIK